MGRFFDWLARNTLCRIGVHGVDKHELSWPVDKSEIWFHCPYCQRVTEVVETD